MNERLLFDTHAHYDDAAFDADREELLARLPSDGVRYVVNVGCDLESSRRAVALAQRYDYLYAGVGIHPGNAEACTPEALAELRRLAAQPKVVAIGEIGLDYHYDTPPRDIQRDAFCAQMHLAQALGLPVSIHDRDAHGESLAIVREFPDVRGVFHCFSGSVETARELVALGWYLGFTGVVTFQNAKKTAAVAADAPEEFTSATNTPSITRNTKMPAFSESAGTRPVVSASSSVPPGGTNDPLMMVFTVSTGSNPAKSSAPTTMPMHSEL